MTLDLGILMMTGRREPGADPVRAEVLAHSFDLI